MNVTRTKQRCDTDYAKPNVHVCVRVRALKWEWRQRQKRFRRKERTSPEGVARMLKKNHTTARAIRKVGP